MLHICCTRRRTYVRYDDNPAEIQGYTKIIKENLPLHKDEIKVLQDIVKQGSGGESQNHLTHAFAVVKILGACSVGNPVCTHPYALVFYFGHVPYAARA